MNEIQQHKKTTEVNRIIRETKEYVKNNTIAMLINNISNTIINTSMILTKMVMDS